ncbi:MAG: hypothetical protein RLZZ611_1356 [Cyanobacteriota bacterium]|jgi:hypothetical protein
MVSLERGMPLVLDLVLLAAGVVLWQRASSEGDDVWSLFLRGLAVIDLVVITIGNGALWIELPLLVLALALPSVAQLEQRRR